MNAFDIASALRRRQDEAGLSTAEVAQCAGCSVLETQQVLAGDAQAPLGRVLAVSEALGYVLVAVPRPAEQAVAAGAQVTEPKVETVVSAALRSLEQPVKFGLLAGRVQVAPDFDAPLPYEAQRWFEYWETMDEQDAPLPAGAAEELRREARRLALHQAAVRTLRVHPERAHKALETLQRWLAQGFPDVQLAQEWQALIKARDWDVLLEQSERGKRLRKGSPVSCILDQEERLAIFQRFARRARRES